MRGRGPRAGSAPSLKRRLFLALGLLSVAAALSMAVAAGLSSQAEIAADARERLSGEIDVIAAALDASAEPEAVAEAIVPADMRFTLVSPTGEVLADSETDAAGLENHAGREEVAEALETGAGSAERYSTTTSRMEFYEARRLANGDVVRLGLESASVYLLVSKALGTDAVVLLGILAAAWACAWLVSRWIARPFEAYAAGRRERSYAEVEPLLDKIDEQKAELARQVDELSQLDAMRRDFTSNVTHELKTPLASIMMASEMMSSGFAAPEDYERLSALAYKEAARMNELVGDLLTLSKLDEAERAGAGELFGPDSAVDLGALAQAVCGRYADAARGKGVALSCEVGEAWIAGNAKLLDMLVSNLVDNAVRYTPEGGEVRVDVEAREGAVLLGVTDTGAGIPAGDVDKVFERFYRVDASRDRSSGGTGLGLAIVKHAAAYHGAEVSIESELGVGTRVEVAFPA
jgi:two-component system phosphate regulon sensor histidine kinase PhoR